MLISKKVFLPGHFWMDYGQSYCNQIHNFKTWLLNHHFIPVLYFSYHFCIGVGNFTQKFSPKKSVEKR